MARLDPLDNVIPYLAIPDFFVSACLYDFSAAIVPLEENFAVDGKLFLLHVVESNLYFVDYCLNGD